MSPRSLSDKELHSQLKSLVERERRVTLDVIAHLNEVEQRRLHFKLGYGSLFDYCTRGLGYSESAANRRIRAARCARRSPAVRQALAAGDVNVSTVSQVARIVTPSNQKQIVAAIAGRSQREVEKIVAQHNPEPRPRERVRPVCVPAPKCQQSYRRCGGKKLTTANETELQQLFELKFAVSPEAMKKLERVKSLLSSKHPQGVSLETALEATLDVFIEKHDPVARKERRDKRKKAAAQAARARHTDSRNTHNNKGLEIIGRGNRGGLSAGGGTGQRTRHIPTAIRDAVLARDGSQCAFVSAGGRRCGSTHDLEIDHVEPFARGGSHDVSNLRVLCAQHNRIEAERILGIEHRKRE